MDKRLSSHRNGQGAKYTRGRGPLTPVYLEYVQSRSDAVKREAEIKKLTRQEKLRLIKSPANSLNKRAVR